MSDVEFNKQLAEIRRFEDDLKSVFEKHNVTLKEGVEAYHGGCDDIIKIIINGERWINWDFDETLRNIGIIK